MNLPSLADLDQEIADLEQVAAKLRRRQMLRIEIANLHLGIIRPSGVQIIGEVTKAVCAALDVTAESIQASNRGPEPVSTARQIIYFIAAQNGLSQSEIGRRMNRVPGSVKFGIKAIRNRCDLDSLFLNLVNRISAQATLALDAATGHRP